jgi:GTP cyclohydrolase IB
VEDVQSRPDERNVALDQVGVSDLRYPIVVLDRDHQVQHTIANISMSVGLPEEFKGTHMSRFIEILNEHRGEVTMRTLPIILSDLRRRLHAKTARVEVVFPYFIEQSAPVSGAKALMDYECSFIGQSLHDGDDFVLGVKVPVTSLCPCSKEISDYGAHNQRGHITIQTRGARQPDGSTAFVWIEDLVLIAEQAASAPVYPLLKRPDERYVTMQAYDNPVFVEDMVREVAVSLQRDQRVAWFHVRAVNQESIHNHAAFAQIEWLRPTTSVVESDAVGAGAGRVIP